MKLFLLLILAHVLGDTVFNHYRLAVLKRDSRLSRQVLGAGLHAGIHALCAGVLVIAGAGPWARAALLVLLIHFLIDFARGRLEAKRYGAGRLNISRPELIAWLRGRNPDPARINLRTQWFWILINLSDQGSHFLSIVAIALAVGTA